MDCRIRGSQDPWCSIYCFSFPVLVLCTIESFTFSSKNAEIVQSSSPAQSQTRLRLCHSHLCFHLVWLHGFFSMLAWTATISNFSMRKRPPYWVHRHRPIPWLATHFWQSPHTESGTHHHTHFLGRFEGSRICVLTMFHLFSVLKRLGLCFCREFSGSKTNLHFQNKRRCGGVAPFFCAELSTALCRCKHLTTRPCLRIAFFLQHSCAFFCRFIVQIRILNLFQGTFGVGHDPEVVGPT